MCFRNSCRATIIHGVFGPLWRPRRIRLENVIANARRAKNKSFRKRRVRRPIDVDASKPFAVFRSVNSSDVFRADIRTRTKSPTPPPTRPPGAPVREILRARVHAVSVPGYPPPVVKTGLIAENKTFDSVSRCPGAPGVDFGPFLRPLSGDLVERLLPRARARGRHDEIIPLCSRAPSNAQLLKRPQGAVFVSITRFAGR